MLTFGTKNSFVIYKKPYQKEILIRKGKWESFINQQNGFITTYFDNSEKFILTNEASILEQEITIFAPKTKDKDKSKNREEYIKQLHKFINSCNRDMKKIVSSRKKIIETKNQIDIFQLFINMTKEYDDALVYCYNIPKKGMWMGASPETLIHSDLNTLYTIALAGSQPLGDKIEWSKKEIDEHQYVIDDISNKLNSLKVNFNIENTKTSKAGKVAHLKTKINLANKHDLKQIINQLHPTSAICGMPQIKAKNFILKNENYNREFYTGFLGDFDQNGASWLFINLRSMQVFKQSFTIYVGGGITIDSIAEKEWEETELKSKTLLSVIEKL